MHTKPWVCLPSAQLRIYTSNSERFLSRACVSQCFLSFIEYLNKKNIWESVPSPHSVFPLLSLRGLWSHLWHNSSISKPNITVSTSETSRLCSAEGYVGVCDFFFFKCQNSVCFSFTSSLCFLLRYSCQGKAAGGLHSKYRSACLSVILPICASAWPSSIPVSFATTPTPPSRYSSRILCLEQSVPSSGLCRLSPSVPEFVSWLLLCVLTYLFFFVAVHSPVGLVYVRVRLFARQSVCLSEASELQRAHLSVRRLSAGY